MPRISSSSSGNTSANSINSAPRSLANRRVGRCMATLNTNQNDLRTGRDWRVRIPELRHAAVPCVVLLTKRVANVLPRGNAHDREARAQQRVFDHVLAAVFENEPP